MKKLLCLALCLVMVMSLFLVGCGQKNPDELDPIEGEEEEVRNAITLKFYIVTDEVTTEDAKDAMQDAFNTVARAKYSTQVEFVFSTIDEYKATLDKALSDAKENIQGGASNPSNVYEGYIPETVLDEFNLPELVYPELIDNQIDIVLITDKAMLEEYVEAGHLMDVTSFVNGDNDAIKEYINTSLLTNTKISGKWYAVPNNVVVGNYEYLLINKELASNYYLVESDFVNIESDGSVSVKYEACLDFAMSIANDSSLENVAPIEAKFDFPTVKFWSEDGSPFALATFYNATTGYGDYITVSNALTNKEYVDYLKFITESETYGYFADGAAEKYGIRTVVSDYASRFSYEKENFVVVLDTPRVYSTDGFSSMFAVTNYTASASRSMELIEDLITDSELCNILLYGVEGSDYYYNEDGTVTRISNVYKMNNQHVGNVFMTYPCTNDGMFADYWLYGMYQNQEASTNPLEGCDSNYVWTSVRKGIVDDQLVNMMRAEYKKITMKEYAATDLSVYTTRLRQYFAGIDPDVAQEEVEEETISQLITNIEAQLAIQYETYSAEDNSRVKLYAVSVEDMKEILEDFEQYPDLINTNTRRITQKVLSSVDDETKYEVLKSLKEEVVDTINDNARNLVNTILYGEDMRSDDVGGFEEQAAKLADETIALVKETSAGFFATIDACTTADEIEEVINGDGGIVDLMTVVDYKDTSKLFVNSRSGAWIADVNVPFGMLEMTYMDTPIKSTVSGVILTWYRTVASK